MSWSTIVCTSSPALIKFMELMIWLSLLILLTIRVSLLRPEVGEVAWNRGD